MHKISPSRLNIISSLAAAVGIAGFTPEHYSTAQVLTKRRGRAPTGYYWTSGVYVPGGETPNVDPTRVRNPKVRANVQMMHEKWRAKKSACIKNP
jgi:hypothetical protein